MKRYCYMENINERIIHFNNRLCNFHKLMGRMVKHGDYFRLMTVEWPSTLTLFKLVPKLCRWTLLLDRKGKTFHSSKTALIHCDNRLCTRLEKTWRLLHVNDGDSGVNSTKEFVETSHKTTSIVHFCLYLYFVVRQKNKKQKKQNVRYFFYGDSISVNIDESYIYRKEDKSCICFK